MNRLDAARGVGAPTECGPARRRARGSPARRWRRPAGCGVRRSTSAASPAGPPAADAGARPAAGWGRVTAQSAMVIPAGMVASMTSYLPVGDGRRAAQSGAGPGRGREAPAHRAHRRPSAGEPVVRPHARLPGRAGATARDVRGRVRRRCQRAAQSSREPLQGRRVRAGAGRRGRLRQARSGPPALRTGGGEADRRRRDERLRRGVGRQAAQEERVAPRAVDQARRREAAPPAISGSREAAGGDELRPSGQGSRLRPPRAEVLRLRQLVLLGPRAHHAEPLLLGRGHPRRRDEQLEAAGLEASEVHVALPAPAASGHVAVVLVRPGDPEGNRRPLPARKSTRSSTTSPTSTSSRSSSRAPS
jgi:hypothetical protein